MSIPRNEKIDFWIKNNLNVLFVGKHGIGKSAVVKEAFERHNLRWKYFSCATLDAWVDFVGVPKEVKNEDGTSYLDLIRPKDFQEDIVDAIFFDEYNRAPKKVKNAVMELIQFKSINGKKFNNLKIIWAAINPHDEEETYDVERMDPAQEDRFHIKIELPYEPNISYFTKEFGKTIGKGAVSWWNTLDEELKNNISPRRLDYALKIWSLGGDIKDVLPKQANSTQLIYLLKTGPIREIISKLIEENDQEKIKEFIINENNYTNSIEHILKSEKRFSIFLPFVSDERLMIILSKQTIILDFIVKESFNNKRYKDLLSEALKANTNKNFTKKINAALKRCNITKNVFLGNNKKTNISMVGKIIVNEHKYTNPDMGTITVINDTTTFDFLKGYEQQIQKLSSNTTSRAQILKIVYNQRPMFGIMTINHAFNLLHLLQAFSKRTQAKSLPHSDFMKLFNCATHFICTNKNITSWKEFCETHGSAYAYMINKIENSKLSSKVWKP